MLGLRAEDVLLVSAKNGQGVPELLEEVIKKIPEPKGKIDEPLQALIFDSYFDSYRGVIPHIRIFSGRMAQHDKILVKSTGKTYEVDETGYFTLDLTPSKELVAGEVGYVGAIMREVGDVPVGDTIVSAEHPETPAIPGFRHPQPMVFCGLYPISTNEYNKLGEALEKLQLNDSSIIFEKETSAALGHGYRAGFLGMLHMEITIERLTREYDQELIATTPSVIYKIVTHQGEELMIDNPSKFPNPQYIEHIEEPIIKTELFLPSEYIGPVMELSEKHRGMFKNMQHPDPKRAVITYDFPLSEIITGYYDKLKSVSRGYASMDYEFVGYKKAELVKVDIMVKGDIIDALSFVSPKDAAAPKSRVLIHKLRGLIPRQLFEIPLQAAVNGRIIAREDIVPLRKDVLAKCYGGDVTRKRKLLEKQKEGKKKMKMIGSVEVPQEAFLVLLKMDEE
jgi:GTP-binding protein LepA